MNRFGEISETQARKIDRRMIGMAEVDSLENLEQRFISESGKILHGDCLCWNNWAVDWTHLQSCTTNTGYLEESIRLTEALGKVVGKHPLIASNNFPRSAERVMQMSEFESPGKFKNNPLYREVYRHLDSHYQICYAPCLLSDRRILLTWNRRALDFTERDRQLLEYMGQRLNVISHEVVEHQRLQSGWNALCQFVETRFSTGPVKALGGKDIAVLAQLLKGHSRQAIAHGLKVRRDSVDKRLGAIRERLGLENHHQLLSAMVQLRSKIKTAVICLPSFLMFQVWDLVGDMSCPDF